MSELGKCTLGFPQSSFVFLCHTVFADEADLISEVVHQLKICFVFQDYFLACFFLYLIGKSAERHELGLDRGV